MTTYALFPLTPALSLRERERRRPVLHEVGALGLIARRHAILPLPEGEGRGEGKGTIRPRLAVDTNSQRRTCFT